LFLLFLLLFSVHSTSLFTDCPQMLTLFLYYDSIFHLIRKGSYQSYSFLGQIFLKVSCTKLTELQIP
jgi:hypothetical protein